MLGFRVKVFFFLIVFFIGFYLGTLQGSREGLGLRGVQVLRADFGLQVGA